MYRIFTKVTFKIRQRKRTIDKAITGARARELNAGATIRELELEDTGGRVWDERVEGG